MIVANATNQAIGLPDHKATYAYDATGNRTTLTNDGANINYAANALNQYTTAAGDPLTYNANGSLTTYKGWTYTYDAQNRMTNAQKGSNIQMTFAYDALNRCIMRTLNGVATYLSYAGWNLIEEHSSNGNLNVNYIHGAHIDEMLIKNDASSIVFYHEDALGNVTHLTDQQGNLVEQYRYDAFGKPIFLDDQGNVLTSSAYGNRFLFTGREWLQEIALYDYRNRIYSPELGRFQQTDPIGFSAGDVNIYRYCGNDPVNRVDPMGLDVWVENTSAIAGLHQRICVDTWDENCCKKTGKYCITFGNPEEGNLKSKALGVGCVCQDSDGPGYSSNGEAMRFHQDCKTDKATLNWFKSLEGLQAMYAAGLHDCDLTPKKWTVEN